MRRSFLRLAQIKPATPRYLQAHAPTGLTGLLTSANPRSTLRYLYLSTLNALSELPSESVYRQSTEALIRNRLEIVNAVVPESYPAWREQTDKLLKQELGELKEGEAIYRGPDGEQRIVKVGGETFVQVDWERGDELADRDQMEWDGEEVVSYPEGSRSEATINRVQKQVESKMQLESAPRVDIEAEPGLTADQ